MAPGLGGRRLLRLFSRLGGDGLRDGLLPDHFLRRGRTGIQRLRTGGADSGTGSGLRRRAPYLRSRDSCRGRDVRRSTGSFTGLCKPTYTYNGKAGTKYYFKVQAVNEAGETSAESELVNKVQVPAQVTSLKATSKKGQVTLKWKKVTGAKKYVIYMSKNGKSGWKKVGTATKNTFVYKKGKVGTKLYFKVQALTANNKKGEFSKVVSIKVKK